MRSIPDAGGFGLGGPLPLATAPQPRLSRNALIVGGVVLFHAAALWGLQAGLLRRAVEVVVPAQVLSEIITPAAPKVEPPAPAVPPQPVHQPVVKRTPALPPAPQPVAVADPTPSPNAATAVAAPQPPAPAVAAPVAVAAAPAPAPAPAPAAPPRIELPTSDADYLQNPKPPYPPVSKRLGEQGTVLVNVLISAEGRAQKAELKKSSGYDRLDQAALAAVLKWRYAPGKRGGVPEAMWFTAPINFFLD